MFVETPKDPMLLVLDLDETLIHAAKHRLNRPADFELFGYYIYVRPHTTWFLTECSRHYNLAIWSSAADEYVAEIVRRIVPTEVSLKFIWGRSRCTYSLDQIAFEEAGYVDAQAHYEYIKPFKKIRRLGYDLARVLIVDDTPFKTRRNYGNAIYCAEYLGQLEDTELRLLLQYLLRLKNSQNVRKIEKRNWRWEALD